MGRKASIATALAGVLLAGLLTVPAAPAASSAAAQARYEQSDPQSFIAKTRHGDLYLEVVHPMRGDKIVKAPVVLTLSPYSVLGRNTDAEEWVSDGYARVHADVVGTGNSGGCFDYGGKREKQSGYDLVEWIAKQPWSNGKIGMTGGSYDGTTATATAVMNPPHLTTIAPVAAISRWYNYGYSGGIRYFLNNEWAGPMGPGAALMQGFDTPLAFDFGLALPPPVDVTGDNYADRVMSAITPCDELEHTMRGYNFDLPNYDGFWKERDYIKDARKVRIPVLIGHNWGDWNVKQEESWNLFRALKKSRKRVLYMGHRWRGHTNPGDKWDKTIKDWMDHYLKGRNNGANRLPAFMSQTAGMDEGGRWHRGGMPKTTNVRLYGQRVLTTNASQYGWQLLPDKPVVNPFIDVEAGFPSTNINAESHALHHSRENHDWLWFETPRLARNLRIVGEIKIEIYSEVDRKWITYTPSVADIDHSRMTMVAGRHIANCGPVKTNPPPAPPEVDPQPEHCATGLVAVTRGWLDSRYRNSLSKPQDVEAGKPFSMTVKTKPVDYTFKKDNMIGVNIQTEINEWSLPKIYPGCDDPEKHLNRTDPSGCVNVNLLWKEGKLRVTLPVAGNVKDPRRLFDRSLHDDH